MGALDSNGIYRYAETDIASPFSDLLNKLASSTSAEVGELAGLTGSLDTRLDSLEAARGDQPWVVSTPVIAGLTLGNGTSRLATRKTGKTVDFRVDVTFGSTSAITADVIITLPYAMRYEHDSMPAVGRPNPSATVYALVGASFSATLTTISLRQMTAGTGQLIALTATTPATWVTGGWFMVRGTYETTA